MFAGLDRIWARKSGNQAPLAEKSGILQGFAEKQPEMRTNEKMKKKKNNFRAHASECKQKHTFRIDMSC